MKSSNPALKEAVLARVEEDAGKGVMTLSGTITKTAALLLVLLTSAGYVWWRLQAGQVVSGSGLWALGLFGGLVIGLATIFVPRWSPYTAPVYAALEGVALGWVSWQLEQRYPGLPMNAALLTVGVLFAMLFLYRARVVKVTQRFVAIVGAAMLGILVYYLISLVFMVFGVPLQALHGGGPMSIGISLFIVGIAALSLVLDFERIAQGVDHRAPKYFEWYSAFGLLVGLIWLYVEILNLLRKLRD